MARIAVAGSEAENCDAGAVANCTPRRPRCGCSTAAASRLRFSAMASCFQRTRSSRRPSRKRKKCLSKPASSKGRGEPCGEPALSKRPRPTLRLRSGEPPSHGPKAPEAVSSGGGAAWASAGHECSRTSEAPSSDRPSEKPLRAVFGATARLTTSRCKRRSSSKSGEHRGSGGGSGGGGGAVSMSGMGGRSRASVSKMVPSSSARALRCDKRCAASRGARRVAT
mmetsp:Transcript_12570/g.41988  ORF Transcript_12570/g.41988 Transcript_12570/m.41988 type:complete len:224 (-) Transcript_12570:2365-3036(-)